MKKAQVNQKNIKSITKGIIFKGIVTKDTIRKTIDYKTAALTLAALLLIPTVTGCGNKNISESKNVRLNTEADIDSNITLNDNPVKQTAQGQIFLYGETHSQEKILEKELEIWDTYYYENGMRDLFVELPYYSAEFLNLWMKAEDDTILEELFQDWEGTAIYTSQEKEFYKKIKENCPDTIFHGTDVGHQYNTTGKRYMEYLLSCDGDQSQERALCQEAIEQGQYYNEQSDSVYRENKMVENFIREYSKLNGKDIMGIYGSGHTSIEGLDYATQTIPCMANQLKQQYGALLSTKDLTMYAYDIDPIRTDSMQIGTKTYQALYYGKQDLSEIFPQYQCREFWRLENAYDDFKDNALTGEYLPYPNYIMLVEEQQVFVIDYTSADGSVERQYFRSDGNSWEGVATTERFVVE